MLTQGVLVVYRFPPDGTFNYDPMINKLTLTDTYRDGTMSISLYTKQGASW